jgi:Dna[CI] antecedent, DciA
MRAQKIEQLIAALPQLRPVLARARQLAELQRIFMETAPVRLSRMSRVAALEGTTLVVFADGGAIGAKLKLLAPSLINKFLLNGQEVTAIRVEVQANLSSAPASKPPLALPAEVRACIEQASQGMPEGELKRALVQLLARAK